MRKYFKKGLAFALCLVMTMSVCVFSVSAAGVSIDQSVEIKDTKFTSATQDVDVYFTIPDGLSDIVALEYKVNLPSGATVNSVKLNSALEANWQTFNSNGHVVLLNKFDVANTKTLEASMSPDGNNQYKIMSLNITLTAKDNPYQEGWVAVLDVTTAPEESHVNTQNYKAFTFTYCTKHQWDDGKVTKEATEDEDGEMTYTCKVCGETKTEVIPKIIPEYTATFKDKAGNTIYTAKVKEGETLADADIDAAGALVPELYGFKRAKDEFGKQLWDNDITQPINSDTTFVPSYEKIGLVYKLNIDYISKADYSSDKDVKKIFGDLVFDKKITLTDESAKYWTVNGKVAATGTTAAFYISGDMDIKACNDKDVTAPSVAVIKDEKGTSLGANTYNVVAKAVVPNGEIVEEGVSFISKTTYDKMVNAGVQNGAWVDNKDYTVKTAKVANPGNDFMATLSGITTTSSVTRYAQAYIKVKASGVTTTYVSDAVFAKFNY